MAGESRPLCNGQHGEERRDREVGSADERGRGCLCSGAHLWAMAASGNEVYHSPVRGDTCSSSLAAIPEMEKPLVEYNTLFSCSGVSVTFCFVWHLHQYVY